MPGLIAITSGSISKAEAQKFTQYVQNDVLNITQRLLNRQKHYLLGILKQEIIQSFAKSNEVYQLIHGSLRYDLGLTISEASIAVEKIAEIISRDISLNFIRTTDTLSFNIAMVRDDYTDILSIPEASFIQYHSKNPGTPIHWLEWLLTRGDEIIIQDYRVMYKSIESSRSGGAIMIHTGNWRVPPQFSGTHNNNIITRALAGVDERIYQEILNIIQ